MPGVDFLAYTSEEHDIDESTFGLCDNPGEDPAHVSTDTEEQWIAVVDNPEHVSLRFLPVDKHIPLSRSDGRPAKRCDVMLFSNPLASKRLILFIELKERKNNKEAFNHAVKQLRSTIDFFSEYHDISSYTKRRAYVANRVRPRAKRSYTIKIAQFYKDYHVRLMYSNTIEIP